MRKIMNKNFYMKQLTWFYEVTSGCFILTKEKILEMWLGPIEDKNEE